MPANQKQIILDLMFVVTHIYFWFGGRYYLQQCGVAMGAKFAPSMANPFMAKWAEDIIYANPMPQLVFWRRYIDDFLLLWDGDMHSLQLFIAELNVNGRDIYPWTFKPVLRKTIF